jgi:ATP-dependent RNA helicase SUPV3L1/SUV3
MLETEIQKSGEVVVEGHVIGRLDGFTFAADAAAGGSEAKALHAAARSALAGEIDARATKVAQAPERDFVLASDGTLRWVGAAVGKLVAGEDVLRPRVRVIADEQLTGAAREHVQTRLDLWLKTHIERVLGPLFALAAADDVTGIARGIAFQLIETLGVLERQKVAEEVKGLDQPSRATLRKYGVRFGAYHLYVPVLLKPAPRALAAQLWALKHEGPEAKGLDELLRLAGSGRTSIPVAQDTSKALYRTIGYRVCGERAIRVDILERLADLIRPALAWREGASGARPAGAVDGFGFTVTGAMTSLTGASGEDFSSILRSLGYRMERRPRPAASDAPPAEAAADAATTATPAETSAPEVIEPDATIAPSSDAAGAETPAEIAAPENAPVPAEAPTETAGEAPAEASAEAAAVATGEAPPAIGVAAPEAGEPAAVPAEPDMIEVWRPGRPGGARRRREGDRRRRRPGERDAPRRDAATPEAPSGEAPVAAAVDGQAAAAEAPSVQHDGDRKPRHGRPGRHRQEREDGEQRSRRPEQRAERGDRPDRGPPRDRPDRSEQRDRGPRERHERGPRRGRERHDDNRPSRTWSSTPAGRGKEPDPNSPFAKLAALKAQLESDKEP